MAGPRERVPRVLVETLAWVVFAAVVALVVIAAGDTSVERAALWAAGLGGIVVAAIVLLALTGTRLDHLARCRSEAEGRD